MSYELQVIKKKVGNIDGFKAYYNDFIVTRMRNYRRLNNHEMWAKMTFLVLRATAMTAQARGGADVTVELRRMKGDEGNFIVQCADEELWPIFTELWQEYEREWGAGESSQEEVNAIYSPLPTIEGIAAYMAEQGVARHDPRWWDIYIDWFIAYRARNRQKALTYKQAAQSAGVSLSEYKRQIGAWEERTGRERDTKT